MVRAVVGFGLLAALGVVGCSIEGSRQRGDECLMDRECVSPLRCVLASNGFSYCSAPVRLDASVPEVGAVDTGPVDTGAPDTGPADVGVDSGPPDLGVDTGPDVQDVGVDAGSDVLDASEAGG